MVGDERKGDRRYTGWGEKRGQEAGFRRGLESRRKRGKLCNVAQ